MGVAAYADDLVLVAPTRHAMQLMLALSENYAEQYNIKYSTDINPNKSKSKCIYMVGNKREMAKPAPLQLCGKILQWVESATHLGHTLHASGSMEQDAKVSRARYIDQTVEVRQSFAFASRVEVYTTLPATMVPCYGICRG